MTMTDLDMASCSDITIRASTDGEPSPEQPHITPVAPIQHQHSRGRTGLHLEDLANEILIKIFQYVDTYFDDDVNHDYYSVLRSLLDLAVCSSRFHRLLEPILYSNVVIKDNFNAKRFSGLPTFLCKILARPELARQVRSLHATARGSEPGFDSSEMSSFLDMSSLIDPDRGRIRAAVQAASESNEEVEDWIEAIEGGTWDSITALILSLVPNIADLQFENWSYTTNFHPFLIRLFERATSLQETASLASPLSLRNLRKMTISYWDTEGALPIDMIIPFLRLKSLTVFHGHNICEPDYYFDDDDAPAWLSSRPTFTTKDLGFSNSDLGHDFMASFLRCFPALERLHYEHGGAYMLCSDFEPKHMMAALEQLKPHLREITFLGEERSWGSSDIESCPVGSFSYFEKLTSIDAFATLMLGNGCPGTREGFPKLQELVDAVPPSLESLTLRKCRKVTPQYLVSQVSQLVLQRATVAPALKRMDLGWEGIRYPDKPRTTGPVVHPGFTKEEATQLSEECEKAGIELRVKYLPPPRKWVGYHMPQVHPTMPYQQSHIFNYPYEGYEKCCEEHGCDPETGGRPGEW